MREGSTILLLMFVLIMVTAWAVGYYLVMIGSFCMGVYELTLIFHRDDPDDEL